MTTRYRSETRFEMLRALPANRSAAEQLINPKPFERKVPANSCNSICFLALPMRPAYDTGRPSRWAWNFFVPSSISSQVTTDLLDNIPAVNGIPLLPFILNSTSAELTETLSRLQGGDRLEFTNVPGVTDETVYDVFLPDSRSKGFLVDLMVIRRYLFAL